MQGSGTQGGSESLLGILRRRVRLALLVFLASSAAVAGLVAALPNAYRSTATVLVVRDDLAGSLLRPLVASEVELRLQSLSQEILSRSRLNELITRFGLYPRLHGRASPDDLVGKFRRDIRMEVKSVDSAAGHPAAVAFVLGYRGTDPKIVAQVTNQLASFYVEENAKTRERQAAGTADFLNTRLDEMKSRLEEQESRMHEYQRRHVGELPQQLGANLATLERLNTELQHNREMQLRALERREREEERWKGTATAAGEEGAEPAEVRLARLRNELTRLQTRYSDTYPEVVRVGAEIEALERQIAEAPAVEVRKAPAGAIGPRRSIDPEVRALEAEERKLRSAITAYQRRVETAPEREQELQELTRDYEATKQLYASLLQQDEEAHLAGRLQQGQAGEQFRILDPALPAWNPEAPDRRKLLLLGLMLSLGLAAGAVVLAEQLDSSFHSVGALRGFTRVPVLAAIPLIVTRQDRWRRRRRYCLGSMAALTGLSLIAGAAHWLGRGNEQIVALLSRGGP